MKWVRDMSNIEVWWRDHRHFEECRYRKPLRIIFHFCFDITGRDELELEYT
jgi:hypothetical protein